MSLAFDVKSNGRVAGPRATSRDIPKRILRCLERLIGSRKFPKPPDGKPVPATWYMVFKTSG